MKAITISGKAITISGAEIKRDNGSGYKLSKAFPGRRFHDKTLYTVRYYGVNLDNSTVTSITKAKARGE